MTTQGASVPARINLDGLRAGQVVLFDGHYYQVYQVRFTEKMYVVQDCDGPGMADTAELDIELHRTLWIEHPIRSPVAPAAPESVVTISIPGLTSRSIVIDGCAYGVARFDRENVHSTRGASFGDMDVVRLVLIRLPSNDPHGSMP